MKRVVVVVTGVAVLVAGPVGATGAGARTPGSPVREIVWGPCERSEPSSGSSGAALAGDGAGSDQADRRVGGQAASLAGGRPAPSPAECATVQVPLDYAAPTGRQITLALNRIKSTAARDHNHLGPLLVNPGGPGVSGRSLAPYVASALPRDVAARFDVIGFDPRGVGASEPTISCVNAERYFAAPRPGNVPKTSADETRLIDRAREYAEGCGERWAWFLPHLTTENTARDMDAIRQALGEEKISYLGYSYGTYLGSVYATLFPQRVRRLVLDSVVDPTAVWYAANVAQDFAFDRRHRDFLGWVARNDDVYRLGRTQSTLNSAWYSMRTRLQEKPAGGVVGSSELDDIYTAGGYTNTTWPQLAQIFSEYVRKGSAVGLVAAFRGQAGDIARAERGYAVYLGIQCRDAEWPRDWDKWHVDTLAVHSRAPFLAWPNAVYNAPCAFWPVPGGTPVAVGTGELPPVLLFQSRRDPATPYEGALRERRLFPTASLVAESGGNHGVALAGNPCADRYLAAYLRDATLPPRLVSGRGPDATCTGLPEPRPAARMAAGSADRHLLLTRLLLGR